MSFLTLTTLFVKYHLFVEIRCMDVIYKLGKNTFYKIIQIRMYIIGIILRIQIISESGLPQFYFKSIF